MLAAMITVTGALGAALLTGVRRLGLWPLARSAPRSSRWARAGDLRRLVVPQPLPGRLVLGRVNGRLVAAEQRHSVIVIAPTQSGKTTSLAVPAITYVGATNARRTAPTTQANDGTSPTSLTISARGVVNGARAAGSLRRGGVHVRTS
jgi:hypothetical protein